MLVSCRYCNGLHQRGTECPRKPKGPKRITKHERFRSSYKWQQKAREINNRDKYLCRVCFPQGKYTYTDLSTHHIDPLISGWDSRLDNYNLITLCREHHEEAEEGKIDRDYLFKLAKEQEDNNED